MCVNCFDTCNGNILSDRCVRYTGEDIPLLGIKKNDPVSLVEKAVIEKLLGFADGSKIKPSGITLGCDFLKTLLGSKDQTLVNLIQMLVDANCSLRTLITQVQTAQNQATTFDVACLEGLGANPSRDQVLQAAVKRLCTLAADVTAIKGDYVKASQLNTLVQQYLTTQAPQNVVVQQYTKMVPHVAYEYYGPLANFDATGKGLSASGFDKVYLCNGLNGTPDKRGRVAVGAVANVPGAALDAEVDPALPANAGNNWALKQKFGKNGIHIGVEHLPPHTHPVIDPGHTHITKSGWTLHSATDGAGRGLDNDRHDAVDFDLKTNDGLQSSPTGITIGATGAGQPLTNVQASIGALFIIHLP